jgi:hypothetical protein
MTTLSDKDFEKYMANGTLIRGGTTSQVGPACYELRMGNIYYDLTENDRPIDASANNNILIKPGHHIGLHAPLQGLSFLSQSFYYSRCMRQYFNFLTIYISDDR